MMLEPVLAGYGHVQTLPLAGGLEYQKGIVVIDALFQYLAHLGNSVPRADEPYRAETVYAAAQRLYSVVNLLIVLIVMQLVRDEIDGHRDTPSLE